MTFFSVSALLHSFSWKSEKYLHCWVPAQVTTTSIFHLYFFSLASPFLLQLLHTLHTHIPLPTATMTTKNESPCLLKKIYTGKNSDQMFTLPNWSSCEPSNNQLHHLRMCYTMPTPYQCRQSPFLGNTQDFTSGFICIYMGEGWAAGGTTPLHLRASQHFPSLFVHFVACVVIFDTPARELTTILYKEKLRLKEIRHRAQANTLGSGILA